jgi:hypothetical protein
METEDSNKVDGKNIALLVFDCFMAVFYLAFGAIFLFTSLFDSVIHGSMRIALGIVSGLYSVFRIYRAIKKVRDAQ